MNANPFPESFPQPLPPIRSPKVNGNAIASMVLGIVGWVVFLGLWCFNAIVGWAVAIATYGVGLLCLVPLGCLPSLFWLAGVITGHMAKSRIRLQGESGNGMAVAGLIMSYIGVGLYVLGIVVVVILLALGVISTSSLYYSGY
jgi:hypothetical protein